MRIVVTGAYGQLGRDVVKVLADGHEVFAFGRQELDVTDCTRVESVLTELRPDTVIYSSAYTAVDRAEEDVDRAYAVNVYGARNVAVVCESLGAKCCYLSTDYVFDGSSSTPYRETDPTQPKSVYGKSKLAGEEWVRFLCTKHFVVRTSWLYGLHGNNFAKTMLRLAGEGKSLSVVDDQIGSPTYTVHLAMFIKDLITTCK